MARLLGAGPPAPLWVCLQPRVVAPVSHGTFCRMMSWLKAGERDGVGGAGSEPGLSHFLSNVGSAG